MYSGILYTNSISSQHVPNKFSLLKQVIQAEENLPHKALKHYFGGLCFHHVGTSQ